MNYFDIIVGILLIFALVKGFKNGLIIEFASLAALVLGVFGAIKFSALTQEWLIRYWQNDYINIVAFFITFILIVIVVHLLAKLLDSLVKAVALGVINRVLGAAFALLKYGFILSVLLAVFASFDKTWDLIPQKTKESSFLYQPLSNFAPKIFPYLNFNENPFRNKEEVIAGI